jgi:hypothetical protein
MLVKDKFPYGDYGVLGPKELATAISRLDQFVFVGLNEMCDKQTQKAPARNGRGPDGPWGRR